eukprot:gb/GEZN01009957.1/.p1 GENE.gb/GEZN01009957.1/~~gb/GEZN01009957.1/.p1  ORF type:complete len:415 (+),score=58.35 gb/GEZN01009957.1/:28-1272(+)
MKVAFLHPDLGIGGAERLVVDAALGLKQIGHDVTMYTSHRDRSHCFQETRDGTLRVVVRGDWMPRQIFHMFHIFFAILRNLWAAFFIIVGSSYDIIIVDQLSVAIPLLRLSRAKILFYCHFPDQLLVQKGGWLKQIYRIPVDFLEEITTGMADRIVVNSKFTAGVFARTFPRLVAKHTLDVLYPSINFSMYRFDPESVLSDSSTAALRALSKHLILVLSINRFERKKNINLAIAAFAQLRALLPKDLFRRTRLVVAGGYDPRVQENVQHQQELEALAVSSGLSHSLHPDCSGQVVFLLNFKEAQRAWLLERSRCVVYTPENEHFGIVPIEAMYARRPVVACNSGGPLESVNTGKTGFLCPSETKAFSVAISTLVRDKDLADKMGEAGRQNVLSRFSLDAFSKQLDNILTSMVTQ